MNLIFTILSEYIFYNEIKKMLKMIKIEIVKKFRLIVK